MELFSVTKGRNNIVTYTAFVLSVHIPEDKEWRADYVIGYRKSK